MKTNKHHILLSIIVLTVVLTLICRFMMTFAGSGEGRYKASPDGAYTAHVMGYETEYFFGGPKRYTRIEIKNATGGRVFASEYKHDDIYHDWYTNGKIVWNKENKVHFEVNGVRFLSAHLNFPDITAYFGTKEAEPR